jgi:ApbE superfamily uncharacterized protein (UPF0280 family)
MSGPVAALLGDGRLHLQHGPIDLVIGAVGREDEVLRAHRQATAAFDGVLERLVDELALLKAPVTASCPQPSGPIARRMVDAVWPHRHVFITPMAAVAGAVADEMLQAMIAGRDLERAYVNDGGDIAVHLARGASMRIGVAGTDAAGEPGPDLDGFATIDFFSPVRGIATSGRGGRSLSLGIADSVTVLARSAAAADAAATMIGNAVDVDHPAIRRRPAKQVKDDSDLGDLLVTVAVGALDDAAIDAALDQGSAEALRLLDLGLIVGALLRLRGSQRVVGGAHSLTRLAGARHPLPTGEGGIESLSRRERVPIASAMGG